MPRKPSDSPQLIYYVETGSEFTFRYQTHAPRKLGRTHCLFATLPSWFFNCKTRLAVRDDMLENVIDDVIVRSARMRYIQVIVDDGKYFLANTCLARIIGQGTLLVRKSKNNYKFKKDSESQPTESYSLHLSEQYYCLSLINPDSNCRIDILHYANFGANTLADLVELCSAKDEQRIAETARMHTLDELAMLKITLFITLHRQYIEITYKNHKVKPRRSLSQTAIAEYHACCTFGEPASYGNEMTTYWERQAVTQPLVRLFGSGLYKGKCYIIDMSSMYPYICMTRRIPASADEVIINPDSEKLEKTLRLYDVIAYCHVSDKTQTIPKIIGGKITWPIGDYNTVLPNPEFQRALEMRAVNRVYLIVRMTDISYLRDFCLAMTNLRIAYEEAGNFLGSKLVKMITNTIFGQLASRMTVWKSVKLDYEAMPWRVWYERDKVNNRQRLLRTVGDECEEMIGKFERSGTQPGSFAFILSHARLLMNDVINIAGRRNVLAANTDSLIVTSDGYNHLRAMVSQDKHVPGMFKVKESGNSCFAYSSSQRTLMPPSEISEAETVRYITARQAIESIRFAMLNAESGNNQPIMPAGFVNVFRYGKPLDIDLTQKYTRYEPEHVSEPIIENMLEFMQ